MYIYMDSELLLISNKLHKYILKDLEQKGIDLHKLYYLF